MQVRAAFAMQNRFPNHKAASFLLQLLGYGQQRFRQRIQPGRGGTLPFGYGRHLLDAGQRLLGRADKGEQRLFHHVQPLTEGRHIVGHGAHLAARLLNAGHQAFERLLRTARRRLATFGLLPSLL